MSFFEIPAPEPRDVAAEEPEEPVAPRWLGGVLPVEELIARSGQAAVAVRRIVAFPDGFQLDVVAWLRRPRPLSRPGSGRWRGARIQLSPHPFGIWQDDGSLDPDFVRFGIQFPGGSRATNLDRALDWPDATEPAHGMRSRGGSASGDEADQEFWVWPVPEAGDLDLVCEWPAGEIAESRLTISGDDLRAAAGRARLIWPEDGAGPGADRAPQPGSGSRSGRMMSRTAGMRAGRRSGPAAGG
jgi:hypothetical protein